MSNPFAGFIGQCVGWVETVLPWVPKGPTYAAGYTAVLPSTGARRITAATAQAGDVVVFQPGQGGASSPAGHIAVVTGTDGIGGLTVSQSNWGSNGLPSVMSIPAGLAATLAVFAPPPGQEANSASRALLSAQGLSNAGADRAAPSGPVAGGTTTSATGNQAISLGQITNDPGFLGTNVPGHVFQYLGQSSLKYSLMFDVASVVLFGLGIYLLFRQQVASAVSPVTDLGGDLVKGAAPVKGLRAKRVAIAKGAK